MEYDDPNVFKLISTGNTKAIFQLESSGFQKFMRELQPTCLEDIIAGVSLYRPGPMDSIPMFVKNKHNPEGITYISPVMEPILSVTYGCIVYQEQVMKIVQELAGYTLSRADSVRKMMGKKKIKDIQEERVVFLNGLPAENGKPAVDGVLKRGVDEAVANKLWDEMEKFGSYAFNKSHAAAYSCVTYQTAYLKTYYEPEFLTSVLNNRITNIDEVKNYVTYAKEENIKILPPDINESLTYFDVKNDEIRFGLAALKNVGIAVVESIIEEREKHGKFISLTDFISRMDSNALNKRCIESMILSGAFDCFKKYRSQMMRVYPSIVEKSAADKKVRETGQFSLFDTLLKDEVCNEVEYPNIKEYDMDMKLKLEKEVVGVYISGHPLDNYLDKYKEYNLKSNQLEVEEDDMEQVEDTVEEKEQDFGDLEDGMTVTCGGIITEVKKLLTKRGNKEMAFAKIEDLYGVIDLMLFPQVYSKLKENLVVDKMVTIKGKLSIRTGEAPCVLVDDIIPWNEDSKDKEEKSAEPVKKEKVLYLKYDTTDKDKHKQVSDCLMSYQGDTKVIVKCSILDTAFEWPDLRVNTDSFLMNELHAFIPDEFIKLV